ncbi:hypothetical protein BDN72DRAFT_962754 [Pluteus cervinus]|uniref:Uncharacterized protein n=1 Tax=Pluteus cervinus TaxID=181527 RepID=A0ACD3AH64_9AGAR|nr:hypothetical protein BDN72DRAFT_962754 [Pluteus cervinus]
MLANHAHPISPSFAHFNNMIVDDQIFELFHVDVTESGSRPKHKIEEKVREELARRAIRSASYDAAERGNPPTCHPETRLVIQGSLKPWSHKSAGGPVRWISGWAGTGKTTIAQTLAEYWAKRGQLAGSFFFSRSSEDKSSTVSFPETILHQLLQLPDFSNGTLVPLTNARVSWSNVIDVLQSATPSLPMIIIIDGLDECQNHYEQVKFLRDILDSVDGFGSSIKFLICCRPEPHLEKVFNEFATKLDPSYHIHLGQSAEDNEDIRTFLRVWFNRIRHNHRRDGATSIMDSEWPSHEQIEELVDRASGQFIFANAVIAFVDDEKEDPAERLNLVLERRLPSFKSIDALYLVILERAEEDVGEKGRRPERRQLMLNLLLQVSINPSSSSDIANFWCEEKATVDFLVKHLQAVLFRNKDNLIKFRHESFHDFLVRPSAPHPFEINPTSQFFMPLQMLARKASQSMNFMSLRGSQYLEYSYLYHDGRPLILLPYEDEVRRFHQRYAHSEPTFRGCSCLLRMDVIVADMSDLRASTPCQQHGCVLDSDLIRLFRMMEMPVDEFLRRWRRHERLRPIAFSILKCFMWLRVMLTGLFDPLYALDGIVQTLTFRPSRLTLLGRCVAFMNGCLCIVVWINTRWELVLVLSAMFRISMLGY